MHTLRRIVAGLLIVLVVAGIAGAVAVTTLGRDTLVPPVAARVKALTGRELTVAGEARIAVALPPRVILRDIALTNAPWASTPRMVEAKGLELTVELLPLLSGRVELSRIALDAPRIAFERDRAGRGNWQFEGTATPAAVAQASAPILPAALVIGNVAIRDGVITYRDVGKATSRTLSVRALDLHTRAVSGDVDLRFTGAVGDVAVDLEGRVGPVRALLDRQWPYPVDLRGTVAGQKLRLAARIRADATRYAFDDLAVAVGANAVRGTLAVDTGGTRPRVEFDLVAPALALAALPAAVAAPGAAAATAPSDAARVIPDTPVSFAALDAVDADGTLAIDRLTLADGRDLGRVHARIRLIERKLDVTDLEAGLFGGTLAGSVSIDVRTAASPTVTTRLEGRAMSLGAILAAAGRAGDVSGGRTDLVAHLTMRGISPHAWASSATGTFRLVSGPAKIVNPKAGSLLAWDRLGEAINPFRGHDPSTELVCAVANLRLVNGVARIDRALAAETSKVGVSASGVLDFGNETLDLVFAPKVRKGIAIDFAGLSDVVRLTGPFAAPRVTMDVGASAKVLASVGAAIGTGGLSAAGQALLSWADGKGPGPCQIALDGPQAAATAAPAPHAGAAAHNPAAPIIEGVGKALGKLFGR